MAFPSKQKILYEQLEQDLRKSYSPGDRLPAERVLAAKYGVARMTLRGALERLVREHRIVRRWNGTFLLGRRNEEFTANDRNDIRIAALPCYSLIGCICRLYVGNQLILSGVIAVANNLCLIEDNRLHRLFDGNRAGG